jgi:mono/diheme cytochrome c family protein
MAKKVYGVTALFNKPDEIKHAAEETVKSGYTKFDVNSPYPVHGFEKFMNIKSSMIGYVTLFFGLFGASFAFLFMTWVTSSNYKLIIGGKPYFTWPAFIPITFEVTVLSAALGTVGVLLFILLRFPGTSHPLHDTDYMKAVSSDKFGLVITAIDPLFDEQRVKDFLSRLGGNDIVTVYEDTEEGNDIKVFSPKFTGALFITVVVTAFATHFVLNDLTYMQPFTWMWFQPKVVPQTPSTFFADGYSMRMPVEGTVARGFIPYEYTGAPDSVLKLLSNPLPVTKEIIERGKKEFGIYCSPCHGYYGQGDSRLKGQFPNPPSLHSDKVRNWSDANIYNVITNGQNVMPSYAKSIPRDDRWAIIHYLRVLQRSQNAPDSDLVAASDTTKTTALTKQVETLKNDSTKTAGENLKKETEKPDSGKVKKD